MQDKICIQWDWKESPDLEKLKKMEELGVFVYEDPTMDGSDSYSFIFSTKKLTPDEIKEFGKKVNGDN